MSSYKITVAASTNIGGSTMKENQDRFYIDQERGIFAVLDGHGSQGGMIAQAVVDSFTASTNKADLFEDAALALKQKPDLQDGGATATVLTINEEANLIVVSAVGDSDARIWLPENRGEQNGYPLNSDHSPASEEEYRRILKEAPVKGAQFLYDGHPSVGPSKDIFVHDPDRDNRIMKNISGNYHNTVRKDWAAYLVMPGKVGRIAVTRAFGNHDKQPYGLTYQPTTDIWQLPSPGETLSIVIASDGFWDVVQYEAVGVILRQPDLIGNAEAAVAALMTFGLAEGSKHFGSTADNITVMVLYVTG